MNICYSNNHFTKDLSRLAGKYYKYYTTREGGPFQYHDNDAHSIPLKLKCFDNPNPIFAAYYVQRLNVQDTVMLIEESVV